MAKNIEIKAKANDFKKQIALAERLADGPISILEQTDTFFETPSGRLKLREFPDQVAQLIYYRRENHWGPKLSDYHISRTPDADELKFSLRATLGELAVVKKRRRLLMCGRTRLHFDEVKHLGEFIELEVVLHNQESIDSGEREAQELMAALNINSQDLISCAYVDLLIERRKRTGHVTTWKNSNA